MIKLGNSGVWVSAWTKTMLSRYRSYAIGVDNMPLRNDGYFGSDEEKVQKEYQRRTKQPETGIVSDKDLHNIGLLPTLFSIHGSGQPDPFGIGYPADIARRLTDVYWWQPVGNYPATSVPMNDSADAGEHELHKLVLKAPGPVAFVDYSQGSIVGGRVRNKIRSGEINKTIVAAASFGNPMRPPGSYAGTVDPGGMGIDPVLEYKDPRCINLAAKGDLYTTCPAGNVGEMERSIFNIVFSDFTGEDSIFEQLLEIVRQPWVEVPAVVFALWNGGLFLVRGTGPHVQYHIKECPGTGMTYYEYAIKYLRDSAYSRLEQIARS